MDGNKGLAAALRVPVHAWVRLELQDGILDLRQVSNEWMIERLQSPRGQTELTHAYIQPHWPLITDTTYDLCAFIARHMDDPGFFDEVKPGITQGNTNYDSQYRQPTSVSKGTYEQKPKE